MCDCGFNGWRGDRCDVPGCPGHKVDCSRHGDCNAASGTCVCNEGWSGVGCHVPDCPGNPDCNGNGSCVQAPLPPGDDGFSVLETLPVCQCHAGFYGVACEFLCVHGTVNVKAQNCTCSPCYHGLACNILCSGIGSCSMEGKCICGFEGGRGDYCGRPGCPGERFSIQFTKLLHERFKFEPLFCEDQVLFPHFLITTAVNESKMRENIKV